MSQLIQPKTYNSREAALRQQRPNALIDEADWAEVPANRYVAMVVHELQPVGFVKVGDLMAIYKGGMTAATPYAPVQKCWSTTALDLVDELLHEAQGTNWTHWAESTRKAFLEAASQHTQGQANESRDLMADSQRRVQRLVAIQAALGLTMQDLAAALNLSRPQLYKWLDPSQDVRLQEAKRQRLDTDWFIQHEPDPARRLSVEAARRLLAWYALRAARPSWPDELERRLRGAKPALLDALTPLAHDIAEVRVAIDERDEELPVDQPYRMVVFFVVEVNSNRSEVVSGAVFTWQEARATDEWNFANLSHREL